MYTWSAFCDNDNFDTDGDNVDHVEDGSDDDGGVNDGEMTTTAFIEAAFVYLVNIL